MNDNMDSRLTDNIVPQKNTHLVYERLSMNCPKPTDFEKFVYWASKEYCLEYDVILTRTVQEVYKNVKSSQRTPSKNEKRSLKPSRVPSSIVKEDSTEDEESSNFVRSGPNIPENKVNIETVYDSNENLVKLKFLKNKIIPGMVMNVIALTISFQKYLTSITINSGLCVDSLYEMSKFLPNSQITEVCLDDTFLSEANYHILLTHGKLKHLSLARCTLNDDVAKNIADQLTHPSPAAKILSALNLSSNKITDDGAKYLADMLRTNRQLCYLNLAGNMITDDGGVCILEILQKFQVQSQELIESRRRYVAHLKEKNALINNFTKVLQTAASDKYATKKKAKKRKLTVSESMYYSKSVFESQIIQDKAQFMADKELGLFNDALSPDNTELRDGIVYCLGNNTLCCLNLAYNNLSYVSLKKLLDVLNMQKYLNRIPRGLMRVVIEGNLMPIACDEFKQIDRLLGSVNSNLYTSENILKKTHLPVKQKEGK